MKEIFIEVDGKKISALVEDKEWQKLVQPVKKTGYEVVKEKECYWTINSANKVMFNTEANREYDREVCDNANYYSDKTVAENNARADKLMRQLRKFAVEHREKGLTWKDYCSNKYKIDFDHNAKKYILMIISMYSLMEQYILILNKPPSLLSTHLKMNFSGTLRHIKIACSYININLKRNLTYDK